MPKRMIITHNYEDLHPVLGKVNVRFIETDEEYHQVMVEMSCNLARVYRRELDFSDQIPTAYLVEEYTKRSDLTGPGECGNDWVFTNAWQAPVSREKAFERKYGKQD